MTVFEHKILRLLDANLNRAMEGLRVVEEVARFILDNAALQNKLKRLRHDIQKLGKDALSISREGDGRMRAVISSRDSSGDVGGKRTIKSEKRRSDISSIVQSNCSRVAESVRVFEEFSKLLSGNRASAWKKLRFMIYGIEKDLLSFMSRELISSRLCNIGLYCIIDRMYLGRGNPARIVSEMIAGGAKIIQYRDKTSENGEFLRNCRRIRKVCADSDCIFIVNDRADIALLVDADGVHVGQDDMPVQEVRRILGPGKIIGKSSRNHQESMKAVKEDIDYLAVGSIFPTETKEQNPVVGPGCIGRIKRNLRKMPIVAIGGINKGNIDQVLAQKPDGICIVSAIQTSRDITKTVRGFVRRIKRGIH